MDRLSSFHPHSSYEIIELLGTGEYGQVVRCAADGRAEEVAIKVIKNTPAHMYQSMMEVRIIELVCSLASFTLDSVKQTHLLYCIFWVSICMRANGISDDRAS